MTLQFEKFILNNGLRVLVHEDHSSPMVAVNVLYDVGARDEDESKTGFAHLFEHLMFGGSVNIPNYDEPLQMAGGENNAYTTNDITNYYIQLPSKNIETAFWLESDRMLSLAFSEKSLDVQRKVVCEEFKEHYINKPYGDAWKHLRALAFKQHPYKWMTIGKELSHIENAGLEDVREFFAAHYNPQSAILCVAGDCSLSQVKALSQKWFEPIASGIKYTRQIQQEPLQTEERVAHVYADVPSDAVYKAWHIAARLEKGYYCADLLTEILGNGNASRLYVQLVKERQLFTNINCYHTGSLDAGLLVMEGKIAANVHAEEANAAILECISDICADGVTDAELEKAKNKIETLIEFEDMSLLSRANNIAFYELLGDASLINREWDNYNNISKESLLAEACTIFRNENCSTLYYLKSNK